MFVSRPSGRITIAQRPNLSLSVFVIASVVERLLHPSGSLATLTRTIAIGALLIWAIDEVLRGANPFRRILGTAVLVLTIVTLAS
jgi:hypothetical protein